MADEPNTAPENQDTPNAEPDAPDTGTREQVDYQKRYEDLRSEFDRRNQQWSEVEQRLESDPAGFLEELGYEIPKGQEDDYENLDPLEEIRAEVETLKADREAEQTKAEATAYEQAELAYINGELKAVIKDAGRDFAQEEIQAIGDLSKARPTEEGLPDVRGAYTLLYDTILGQQKEEWVKSKNTPQVLSGSQGAEKTDLDNPRERQDYVAARLAQIQSEQ